VWLRWRWLSGVPACRRQGGQQPQIDCFAPTHKPFAHARKDVNKAGGLGWTSAMAAMAARSPCLPEAGEPEAPNRLLRAYAQTLRFGSQWRNRMKQSRHSYRHCEERNELRKVRKMSCDEAIPNLLGSHGIATGFPSHSPGRTALANS
jgi:hypothetical protein